KLRDTLEKNIGSHLPGIRINGDLHDRLPNTSSITFDGINAKDLIREMHTVAVSTRSACPNALSEPSHVLMAIGLTVHQANSTIRFSAGRFTTEEEIDAVSERVISSVRRMRANKRSRLS